MPRSRKRPTVSGKTAAQMPGNATAATATQVGDLAWAGQHAKAIELATHALAAPRLRVADQLDLLDLRAESYVAQSDLDRAGADADAMLGLAKSAKIGRIHGAGAEPPGAGGDAQGRVQVGRRHGHGGTQGRASEQADATRSR